MLLSATPSIIHYDPLSSYSLPPAPTTPPSPGRPYGHGFVYLQGTRRTGACACGRRARQGVVHACEVTQGEVVVAVTWVWCGVVYGAPMSGNITHYSWFSPGCLIAFSIRSSPASQSKRRIARRRRQLEFSFGGGSGVRFKVCSCTAVVIDWI